ncbi:MAG: PorT family protein [Cyclobacteriaceae bacterium]|nr:PorT family protein [Cyclobacteriaceae bacterium]UYN86823.1 MAG: PorT family protein [Cyclobacteriaceae bacterium]
MKKLIAVLVFVICIGTGANAQVKISVLGGPSFTTFGGKKAKDWGGVDKKPKMAVRFHGGLVVQYPINDKLSAVSGLQYAVKGAVYEGPGFGQQGEFTAEYKKVLSYIDIPLAIQYAITDKLAIQGGAQVSMLVSAKVKNSKEVQDNFGLPASEDVKDSYKGLDMCLSLGPVYNVTEKLLLQLLYQHGLMKIGQYKEFGADVTYDIRNQGFKVSLIYVLKN